MTTKIKVADHNKDELLILFVDMPIDFINHLRRIAVTQIPTFAIDKVEIYSNGSPVIDEVVVHRLSMIPYVVQCSKNALMKTITSEYYPSLNSNYECNEDEDEEEKDEEEIEMRVKGKKGQRFLTIKELFSTNANNRVKLQMIKDQDIIIAPIYEGGEIWVKATLRLGVMRDHAKWQSCWAYMNHYEYSYKIGEKYKNDENLEKLIEKA